MFVSLKANKKRILAFLVLVVVIVGACFLLKGKGDGDGQIELNLSAATDGERIAFLETFGWKVESEPVETQEVMIPETFNDVYMAYNEMQKAQGFDLKPYAGYKCMQYKYVVTNYSDSREVLATLLVYDDLILGGDLACAEVDGFMHGFAKDSAHYGENGFEQSESSVESQSSAEPNTENSLSSAANLESAVNDENTVSESSEQDESAVSENVEETAGEIIPEDAYPTD